MKSNVSTLRWKMWQNKHRSENEAWKNSGLYGICIHDPCNTNRELVIMLVPNEPVKWWINDSKYMKIVSFFQAYFQYCKSLSSVHYCEDRFRIHFFIRSSHIRFSYIHRQDYNYYKGKMAHNNTQQMESYYNTSINHSINVKQSHDVHFVCGSNNRNKLKIINTGLYMMTIFDEYKSTQNSHIQQNINKPFYQLHFQYRPFYRHTLTTIKWHHKKENQSALWANSWLTHDFLDYV